MENINVILHGKDIIFEKDEWKELLSEDEKVDYKISYKCKLLDKSQNKTTTIGMIKVWCHDDLTRKILLENKDDFERLNDDSEKKYYSIGSDTYYDNLRSFFGDDYKEILRYFNDISFLISELTDNMSYKIIKSKKILIKKLFGKDQKENDCEDNLGEFKVTKCLKPKGNIKYIFKLEKFVNLKELKKIRELKNLKETAYLSKYVYKQESDTDKIDEIISEIHRKENVTYLFDISTDSEKNSKMKRLDSKGKIKLVPWERTIDSLKNIFDWFTEAHTPSIRRIGDIGERLYYPCDMPEQVMFIGKGLEISDLNKKIQNDDKNIENKTKNKIVYDEEYDYRRKNLFYKISLNKNIELRTELNNLRESDKEILVDALRKSVDYTTYKNHIRRFMDGDSKNNDDFIFRGVTENEMLMILKICSFVSRNMFLIILEDISKKTIRIIKNIANAKNFIVLYVKPEDTK